MVSVLKQEEGKVSSLEPCEIRHLMKVLKPDGRPFHERLNEARKTECMSDEVLHLTSLVLGAFGPKARKNAFAANSFAKNYTPLIQRDVLKGKNFPDFGGRLCEKMFVGLMLVQLGPDHEYYDTFKASWNERMQGNCVLP